MCGALITIDHDPTKGMIDVAMSDFDGPVFTWVRHYATAPEGADPRCAVISSRVFLVTKVSS